VKAVIRVTVKETYGSMIIGDVCVGAVLKGVGWKVG
jgi:hypothetical protein